MHNDIPSNTSQNISTHKSINPVFIIGILILLLLVGIIGYFLGIQTINNTAKTMMQITPSITAQQTSPIVNPISPDIRWNIFNDEKLGLSFEYPTKWNQPIVTQLSTRTNIEFKDGQESLDNTLGPKLLISTGVYYNQNLGKELTLAEYIEQFIPKNYEAEDYERVNDYTNSTLSGKIYTHTSRAGMGNWITDVYLASSTESTSITTLSFRYDSIRGPDEKAPPIDSALQQILSTLKIVKITEKW